jgi:hypothetical protein
VGSAGAASCLVRIGASPNFGDDRKQRPDFQRPDFGTGGAPGETLQMSYPEESHPIILFEKPAT